MTEPSPPGITIGVLATAFTGFFFVEPSTVVWALIGSYFGAAGGPQVGWARSVAQYVLASFISALLATLVMLYFEKDVPVVRCAFAVAISIGFYQIKTHFGEQIGGFVAAVFRWLRARFGLDNQEPK